MPSSSHHTSSRGRDSWYRELIITFPDGSQEQFFIELTQTGTHIPRPIAQPAEWTRLEHYKCSCCPLSKGTRYCPAAESLETTLLRLQGHFSHEQVTARAIDGANRETVVKQPLQEVGTVLVHLAVFSSGCPIGRQFRPMLSDMRPFATNEELTRHLVQKMLLKHRGEIAASRQDMIEHLEPLREVFAKLCKRLPLDSKGDAMANSIISVDASTWSITFEIDQAINELADELGLRERAAAATAPPPPIHPPASPSLWQRLKAIFRQENSP